jgi:hypothetical protein
MLSSGWLIPVQICPVLANIAFVFIGKQNILFKRSKLKINLMSRRKKSDEFPISL